VIDTVIPARRYRFARQHISYRLLEARREVGRCDLLIADYA